MKIVQIHNHYRFVGGEDIVFDAINRILKEKGHKVIGFERNSKDVQGLWGKTRAFMEGIYSRSAKKMLTRILTSECPDVVHVHNIYPIISPSVFVACRELGMPVVMRCPDYRLTCPTSWHFNQDGLCERCTDGREYWCILKNCRRNIPESVAYSVRTAVARKFRFFMDNVSVLVPPSEFVKNRLVDAGFRGERILVVPNMSSLPYSVVDASGGEYVAYVGRISPEKGIDTLLTSTRRVGLPLRIAGDYLAMPEVVKRAPANAKFIGHMIRDQLVGFYRNARFLVVPSICFEAFGIIVVEAMSQGLPVIASRMGGLPEIVEDGETGLLFEAGNSEDLAYKMKLLWENPTLCRQMGQAGREKVIREYGEDVYYNRLMAVYEKAISISKLG